MEEKKITENWKTKQNDSNEELYEGRLISKSQVLRVLKAIRIMKEELKRRKLKEEIEYELLNNYKIDEDDSINAEMVYFLPDEDNPEQEEEVKEIESCAENVLRELAQRRLKNSNEKRE